MHHKILKITAAAIFTLCQLAYTSSSPEHKEWLKHISSLRVKKDSIKAQYQRLWKACESKHIAYCSDSLENIEITFRQTNRSIDSILNLRRQHPDSVLKDTGKYQLYRVPPLIIRYTKSEFEKIQIVMEINGDSLEIYEIDDSQYGKRFLHSKKFIDQIEINGIVNTIKEAGIMKLSRRYANFEGDGNKVQVTISQNGSTKKISSENLVPNEISRLESALNYLSKGIHEYHPHGLLSPEEQPQFSKRVIKDFECDSCALILRKGSDKTHTPKIATIKFTVIDTNDIETISTIKNSTFWESISSSILKKENIAATNEYLIGFSSGRIFRPFKRYRFEIRFKDNSTLIIKNQEPIGSASGWSSFLSKRKKQIEYNLLYEVRQDIVDMITNESL